MKQDFAETIRSTRQMLGASRERFAILLEVSMRTVDRWETGQSVPEDRQTIARIVNLKRLIDAVYDHFGNATLIWLMTPNKNYRNFQPLDAIGSYFGTEMLLDLCAKEFAQDSK